MEDPKSSPQLDSTTPAAQPAPAMDIMPPAKATDALKPQAPPPDETTPAPASPQPQSDRPIVSKQTKQHIAKPPKAQGSGVGLAITATVIVVLTLGLLMVYAYLRTQGISLL